MDLTKYKLLANQKLTFNTQLNPTLPGAGRLGGYLHNMSTGKSIIGGSSTGGSNFFKNLPMDKIADGTIGALGLANTLYSIGQPDVTVEEAESSARTNTLNVGGIEFEQKGPVDSSLGDVSETGSALTGAAAGASAGAVLGPWGAAVGGLLGGVGGAIFGGKAKRAAARSREAALRKVNAFNINNYNDAWTEYLRKKVDGDFSDYGNPEDQQLWELKFTRYSKGKEPGRSSKPNVRLDAGEEVVFKNGGRMSIPDSPRYENDNAYVYIPRKELKSAFIASDKLQMSFDGISPAEKVRIAEMNGTLERDLPSIETEQAMNREMNKKGNKSLRKFAFGWENVAATVPNMLASMSLYKEASEPLNAPSVYSPNRYEGYALDGLSKLRVNMDPIIQNIRNTYGRYADNIRQSGGLGIGQRAMAQLQGMTNTQRNYSDAIMNAQLLNNKFASDTYHTALSSGATTAQQKLLANIFNTEFLAKAHNAALQGKQMSMFNAINALQQYYANEFKRKQWEDNMDLYRQRLDLDRDEIRALLGGGNNPYFSRFDKHLVPQNEWSRLDDQMVGKALIKHSERPTLTDEQLNAQLIKNAPDFVRKDWRKLKPVARKRRK